RTGHKPEAPAKRKCPFAGASGLCGLCPPRRRMAVLRCRSAHGISCSVLFGETSVVHNILAVVAGSVLWTILWLGFHAVLASRDPETFDGNTRIENVSLLSVILGYSVIISVIAGFAMGMVARKSPIRHTIALGLLQLALGVFFEAMNWHLLPVW